MFRTLALIFLFLHLLGDFYLQPAAMAEKKRTSYPSLLLHSGIYAAVFLAGAAALWSPAVFLAAGALAALHWALDSVKSLVEKPRAAQSNAARAESILYCADQGLHLASIAAAAVLLRAAGAQIAFAPPLAALCAPADALVPLKWLCLLAAIAKPANVTIKKLVSQYRPKEEEGDSPRANAGAFIGTLERIIIALLLSVSEYAAIGLVLTAKSVARYKKIAEEQSFAEYYLLGTLLSTLLVIAAYLLLFTVV